MTHVKITSSDGLQHVIEIDGHPVQNSVTSLVYAADSVHRMPVLDIRLCLRKAADISGPATVRVDEDTARALQSMGWTPPAEEEETTS